jgi:uncharacterized membrane protein SpoIIM required for sporulation
MVIRGLEFYASMLRSLRGDLILFSALLFFCGLFFAPVAVEREISPLLVYPRWIWTRIQRWLGPKDPFITMVLIIFSLNAISLFLNMVSGFLTVLPFVFAFLVGLHIGVIMAEQTGMWRPWGLFLNPVAFLELPLTWVSLSIGMELGLSQLHRFSLTDTFPFLRQGLVTYGMLILPLLLVAAFIEVVLIKWGLRLGKRTEREDGSNGEDFSP